MPRLPRLAWISVLCLLLPCVAGGAAVTQQPAPVELYEARQRGLALARRGQADSALPLLRRVVAHDSADAELWQFYGRAAAEKDLAEEAVRALEHAFALGAFNRGVTAMQIASLYARLGQPTRALDWLERAAANRVQHPERVLDDPAFAALRDSARLATIYSRAGAATLTREEKWRRDIDFFSREARRMHAHPERPAHSQAFADSVAALKARVPVASDININMGLRRLVVMLGDSHSAVARDSSMRMLPIDVYLFGDGVYVVNGLGDAAQHVGRRVVAIGNRGIEDVVRAVGGFIPRDNESDLRARLPAALINTAFLAEVGVANGDGTVDVALEDRAAKRITARLSGGPMRASSRLPARVGNVQLPYLDRSRPIWTRDVPEARALYINFNAVAETDSLKLAPFARRLAIQLRDAQYRHLIIDVRLNGGGNTFLLPPLIQAIASFTAADTSRRVYVITSRHTFSAAQNFVGKLEWLVNPILVGEPTGSAPNFTGETTATVLPYSGLMINISNRWHMNSDWEDKRDWIAPDIPVPVQSADYLAGRDPALEAVLALIKRAMAAS